jgi:hypothetical protein
MTPLVIERFGALHGLDGLTLPLSYAALWWHVQAILLVLQLTRYCLRVDGLRDATTLRRGLDLLAALGSEEASGRAAWA